MIDWIKKNALTFYIAGAVLLLHVWINVITSPIYYEIGKLEAEISMLKWEFQHMKVKGERK